MFRLGGAPQPNADCSSIKAGLAITVGTAPPLWPLLHNCSQSGSLQSTGYAFTEQRANMCSGSLSVVLGVQGIVLSGAITGAA